MSVWTKIRVVFAQKMMKKKKGNMETKNMVVIHLRERDRNKKPIAPNRFY